VNVVLGVGPKVMSAEVAVLCNNEDSPRKHLQPFYWEAEVEYYYAVRVFGSQIKLELDEAPSIGG